MKKLMEQILKFGIVGVICFFIDYLVGIAAMNIAMKVLGEGGFATASTIGSVLGFIVSVIANYILSFKFVFQRKENMDRRAEFVIFLILSVIGLGINQLMMWLLVDKALMWYMLAKIFATAVVMAAGPWISLTVWDSR